MSVSFVLSGLYAAGKPDTMLPSIPPSAISPVMTMNRRQFLTTTALAAAASVAVRPAAAQSTTAPRRFYFAVKSGMINDPAAKSWEDKFKLLKDLGYDGIEFDSQYAASVEEALAAKEKSGLPVHGVVNANHWSVRLSDPSADIRAKAVSELQDAVRFSKAVGGSTVLLVPGAVRDKDNENAEQVWSRSIEGIRQVLPLAAELGIRILIENVWNQFLYQHGDDAPTDQTAEPLIRYLAEINSPWVGSYFDIGNHRKYGDPVVWAKQLDSRIVKLDAKDFRLGKDSPDGKEKWADIGEGSVDWKTLRETLAGFGFYGWATAEVGGGNRERLALILSQMKKTLGGAA